MEKKYEMTDEVLNIKGRELHRIRVLNGFPGYPAGTLGGFIEKEENLSHAGTCFVANDAMVYENAKVTEDAMVMGRARIYGNARLEGEAVASDDARVLNAAYIKDNACISGQAVVYGQAIVCDKAEIFGSASICDNAIVNGCSQVNDSAKVCDKAVVRDSSVAGTSIISGEALIKGPNLMVNGLSQITGTTIITSPASGWGGPGNIGVNICGDIVIDGGNWIRSPIYIVGSVTPIYWVNPKTICVFDKTWELEDLQLALVSRRVKCLTTDAEYEEYADYVRILITYAQQYLKSDTAVKPLILN